MQNQKVGRNDPCPCGSGKKYKKCHGDDSTVAAPTVRQWIQMDHRLMAQLAEVGSKQFQDKGFNPFFLEPEHDHDHAHGEDCHHDVMFADVSFPLSLYAQEIDGKTVTAHFLEGKGKYLGDSDKRWLQAQQAAAFSLWQLVEIHDKDRVTLRDRLRGGDVNIHDTDFAQNGHKDDMFLARIVRFEGEDVLTAVHPELAPADKVEAVAQAVAAKVDVKALHSFATQTALVNAWNDQVFEEEEDEDEEGDDAEPVSTSA